MQYFPFIMTALGAILGSFVAATAWRLRAGKPIFGNDRSHCVSCEHVLTWYDLLPIVSWLSLRGTCRYCGEPISPSYLLIESTTALYFGWFATILPVETMAERAFLFFWVVAAVCLAVLVIIDTRWLLLPDIITLPLIFWGLLQVGTIWLMDGDTALAKEKLLSAALAGGFFFLLYAVSRGEWIGGGDYKLLLGLGLYLSLEQLAVGMMFSFSLAAVVGLGMIGSRLMTRTSLLPFGPFLIAGHVVGLLHGGEIFGWYESLLVG